MLGEAMSILPRSTWAPSANSAARLGDRPPVLADLVFAQAADVGLAAADQLDGKVVEPLEGGRGMEDVFSPYEAQPAPPLPDGLAIFRGSGLWVGVVEPQVAGAAVFAG